MERLIDIIGVAWSGDEATYLDFIDEGGLTFPNVDDTSGDIYNRFGVPYQPAAVIIRPDGSSELLEACLMPTSSSHCSDGILPAQSDERLLLHLV